MAVQAAEADEVLNRTVRIQREIAEFYSIGTLMAQAYISGGQAVDEQRSGNDRVLASATALKNISGEVSREISSIKESASSIDGRVAALSRIANTNVTHIQGVITEARKFHLSMDLNGCPDPGPACSLPGALPPSRAHTATGPNPAHPLPRGPNRFSLRCQSATAPVHSQRRRISDAHHLPAWRNW
ncbi:MAG: hypothetical protein ACLFP6_04770 [Spirochaetaceae bacterium]